jgi:hypothetical protein
MPLAQQDKIFEIRRPFGPERDVMGLAPAGLAATPGNDATPVAGDQGSSLCR